MIPKVVLDRVGAGEAMVAFRRWPAPRVGAGRTQLTAIGQVVFDSVDLIDESALTEADAASAGAKDLAALQKALARNGSGDVYRVVLRLAGPDPRWELREKAPDAAEIAVLTGKLDRMDAGVAGPWTRQVLHWIRENPAVVSTVLAEHLGRERWGLKTDIRRLKALGLTISLDVGYRLSPRGEAFLSATDPER